MCLKKKTRTHTYIYINMVENVFTLMTDEVAIADNRLGKLIVLL